MNLTDLSVRKPVFAWMLMASLLLFGGISFFQLGISEMPDVDAPFVTVQATFEGASPEIMENDVVDVLENALMGVTGIKDITSSAKYGSGSVSLEFELDRNIDVALQEVQSKVSQVGRRLPSGMDPPIVSKQNLEDQPIAWISLSGQRAARELMAYARDKIIPQFQLVPGVGEVQMGGYLEPNIRIWLNPNKMRQYELSVDDVVSAISAEHIERPAGLMDQADKEFSLRVIGEARTTEEMGNISITRRGGQIIYTPIRLKDIGRVESGLEDVRRIVRVKGENAIGMGIRKQRGENAVAVADGVFAKMRSIQETLPEELKIGVNFDSTQFIRETIHELQFELVLSGILTAIMCWLFLGSWSATFNVLLAIPTSLIGSFIAIKALGFTLNTFTFLALILVVGIVVDDAIMVLENIYRHRDMGKNKVKASLDGTGEIAFAAMATTLAICAIFLPVAFMKGMIGKFFLQFGITITVAVLISLLEALTLTPMRSSQFMEKSHGDERWMDRLMNRMIRGYGWLLGLALNHRWKVVFVSTALFLLSFLVVGQLKKEFSPSQDMGIFMMRMQTKVGSSIGFTNRLVGEIESILGAHADVERYFVSVGGFGSGQVNTAFGFVTLKPHKERKRSQQEIMAELREKVSKVEGIRVTMQELGSRALGGGRGFPIEFNLRGPDWDELIRLSREYEAKLKEDKRLLDVDTSLELGMPEVRIVPLRDKALQYGVSVEKVAEAVSLLAGGERISRFSEGGKRIDVRIRLDEPFLNDPDVILNFNVRNNRGELIRLGQVAKLERVQAMSSITRQQRERYISVTANLSPDASQAEVVADIEKTRKELPQGYSLVMAGSSKSFDESSKGLGFAMWLGVLVAYMILASQYNSFIHAFTVLLSMPFSVTGAFIALWLGGASLNVYSMIGLILLMGVVKKNAILLVDFTNQQREKGKGVREALLEACPLRLRPILMTSITLIAAAVPPVLALGPGAETRAPMSLAVIGGVTLSTFFTLFVVPCAYSLLSRFERRQVISPEDEA